MLMNEKIEKNLFVGKKTNKKKLRMRVFFDQNYLVISSTVSLFPRGVLASDERHFLSTNTSDFLKTFLGRKM